MLHYKEHGDEQASLMVFLHGGGVSSWMWEKQIEYFSHYHCLVPDLPEQGLSQKGTEFSIQSCAVLLNNLIEEKGKGKQIIVIGFSLGAQILIQMVSMKPNLVDYAVINSALVRPVPLAKRWIRPSVTCVFPLIKNRTFSRIQAKALYVSQDHVERYYQESCQMSENTLVRILEENMSFKLPVDFDEVQTKILVTVGEMEKAIMKKSALDIVNSNAHAKGLMMGNIGHGVTLAMPDFFNEVVERWMEKEGHEEIKTPPH